MSGAECPTHSCGPMKTSLTLCTLCLAMCLTSFGAEGKNLQHVVSFKFKDSATKEQIKEVVDAFRDLKGKIKEIKALEWGTNVSPEKHDKGFPHCWVLSFSSDKD